MSARPDPPAAADRSSQSRSLQVRIPPLWLEGTLVIPEPGHGMVLFAHGSGSGRLSPRNRFVARGLGDAGLGTLLFDLLLPEEADDRRKVFDIGLLADRLVLATDWLRRQAQLSAVPIGYFGASTGAAAALVAETVTRHAIAAIVSRGGRPDLAGPALADVRAPTLLIVGSLDAGVIELNEEAFAELRCEKHLVIVPGAGHLFEESGTLEQVIDLARDWFVSRFTGETPR